MSKRYLGGYITTSFDPLSFTNEPVIENIPVSTTNLIAYYDAGMTSSYPGSGTTWNDKVGTNHGTLTSGTSFVSTSPKYMSFDGVDDYVAFPLLSSSITNVTMQVWAYINLNTKGAIMRNGGGANGYSMGIGSNTMDTNGSEILGLYPNIRWIDTNTSYTAGWHLVTMVISASSVPSLYVDTTLIGTYTGTNPITPTTGTYLGRNIGDEGSGNRAFTGYINSFWMYSTALDSTAITSNYNATKAKFGL